MRGCDTITKVGVDISNDKDEFQKSTNNDVVKSNQTDSKSDMAPIIIAVLSILLFFLVPVTVFLLLTSLSFRNLAMIAFIFPIIGLFIMIYGLIKYPKNPVLIGVLIAEIVLVVAIIVFVVLLFVLIFGSYWVFFGMSK